jgi:hypothetical protein
MLGQIINNINIYSTIAINTIGIGGGVYAFSKFIIGLFKKKMPIVLLN